VSAQREDKLQNGVRLCLKNGLLHQLSSGIYHGNRDRFFVNIHANIFRAIHCRFAPFGSRLTLITYLKRGRPLAKHSSSRSELAKLRREAVSLEHVVDSGHG